MNDVAVPEALSQRPGVFTLVIRSKAALYAAWIPLLRGGGIFLPSNRPHALGEEVLILLSLLDDPNKIPLQGHVAWINPAHSAGNRPQGIGVQRQCFRGGGCSCHGVVRYCVALDTEGTADSENT